MRQVCTILAMVTKRRELVLLAIVALVPILGGCVALPPVPYAPSSLTAIAISPQQIDLSWKDNARMEKGFYVYRKRQRTGDYVKIVVLDANTTSYTDSFLDPGTTYWYKVAAYNDGGESNSSEEKSAITQGKIQSFFDLSTPENTIRSFYEALFLDDKEKTMECLSDKISEGYKEVIAVLGRVGIEQVMKEEPIIKTLFQDPAMTKEFLEMYRYEKEQVNKESFYVWWTIPGIVSTENDAFKIVKENNKWKIIGIRGTGDFILPGEEEEELAEEEIEELLKLYEKAEKNPDFYGERLLVVGPSEDAFKLEWNNEERKIYIIRYEGEEGKKKVDSSIYSYAFFDPFPSNLIGIDVFNDYPYPIETDYYKDRYYVISYGGNMYQTEIDTEWDLYRKVINPQEKKRVWIKYPASVSKIDIKGIIIKLAKSGIVVGLQKVPR